MFELVRVSAEDRRAGSPLQACSNRSRARIEAVSNATTTGALTVSRGAPASKTRVLNGLAFSCATHAESWGCASALAAWLIRTPNRFYVT